MQRAAALVQEGRLREAIAEYRAVLSADPSDPSLYNTLGDLYAQIGAISDAVGCYLSLGEALTAEGLGYRAIAAYKKVVKLDPDNLRALRACADLYEKEGLRAEAKHQCLLAAERSLKHGLEKQAMELYERVLMLDPADALIAAKLASLLASGGRRTEAGELLGRLAQEMRTKGRLDDARRLYQQMVEACPEMFTGWYGLGRVEMDTGRLQEAEAHLRQAARLDMTSPLPHLLLARLYEQRGQLGDARAACHALLQRDPEHQEGRHLFGRVCLMEGDAEEAAQAYAAVASSLCRSGEVERALALLAELGPAADHPMVQERLAELLARAGRTGDAKAAYLRAAELYQRRGEVEARRRMLNGILALDPEDGAARDALALTPASDSEPIVLEAEVSRVTCLPTDAGGGDDSSSSWARARAFGPAREGGWNVEEPGAREIEILSEAGEGLDAGASFSSLLAELGRLGEAGPAVTEPAARGDAGARGEIEPTVPSSATGTAPPELPPAVPACARGEGGQQSPAEASPAACEAHYHLGLAYREMGLMDEAIAEFRRSAADERFTVVSGEMIGLCLLAKGDAEAAIHEFGRALSIEGRPPAEYDGVKYNLAAAYEAIGDADAAEAILRALQASNPSFRDLESRLRRLVAGREQAPGQDGAATGTIDAARQTRSS